MLKKLAVIIVLVSVICSVSTVSNASGFVTLYSWDGRQQLFWEEDVEAQLGVGWYRFYPVLMHADDGREMYVSGDEVETYLNLNWYLSDEVDIYVVDSGKTIYVPYGTPALDNNRNFYWQTPVKMYSEYGEKMTVSRNLAETYKSLNWFYTEPVVMWTEDGRIICVEQYEVEAYKNVGWYSADEEFPEDLYTLDGRYIFVRETDVEKYLNLGWYKWEDMKYINFQNEVNACMKSGDYEGVYGAFEDYEWSLSETQYQDELYNAKYRAREAWRKAAGGAPLVFTGYQNIDGNEVEFKVRNISYKPIIAVKIDFVCYDIFGIPMRYCYGISWGSDGDLWLDTDDYSFFSVSDVSGIDGAYRVGNLKVTDVIFSDNSRWTSY